MTPVFRRLLFVVLYLNCFSLGLAQNGTENKVETTKGRAEQGDAAAQIELGMRYQDGIGVHKDEKEAVSWYTKAAEQGNAAAIRKLVDWYSIGLGKDEKEAVKWYCKAALQGYAPAQKNLGVCFEFGTGVGKDEKEAVKWYTKAAEQGNADGQCYLGVCYKNGLGVGKDEKEAVKWFTKAAEQGIAPAQFYLGVCYKNGEGVSKDEKEAVKWYTKAAEQGNARAQRNLGVCYQNGQGVSKDEKEAVKWFTRAAERGDADAQGKLGVCYVNGQGVGKDVVEAKKWFTKAAEQGDANAACRVSAFYIDGVASIKDKKMALEWAYVARAQGCELEVLGQIIEDCENTYTAAAAANIQESAKIRLAHIRGEKVSNESEAGTKQISERDEAASLLRQTGTGFILSEDGYVVTAAHVIEDGKKIEVLTGGEKISARAVATDFQNDVSILKCDKPLKGALPLRESSGLKVGATVFTIGFPNFQRQGMSPKMTKGEISSNYGILDSPTCWQISTPVQSGNSGGPLFDSNGNVIGVVVARLKSIKDRQGNLNINQNVNYALKNAYLDPLIKDLNISTQPARGSNPLKSFESVVEDVEKSVVMILVY
jgi:TPR repeat protein/S1-C subfamily serine protease